MTEDQKLDIREKKHRLRPEAYRGRVICAFTIDTADGEHYFNTPNVIMVAHASLAEAFTKCHGHAAVYVFMPDHLHLMVSGQDERSDLLALLKDFKQKTTFRLRQKGISFGWQKDFYDHIIRANEDYGAQVRYLLRNPVRWGLCACWGDWPHKGVLGQTWEQLAENVATL